MIPTEIALQQLLVNAFNVTAEKSLEGLEPTVIRQELARLMAEGIVTTITGKPLASFYIISRAISRTEWDEQTGQIVIYFTDTEEPFRTGDLRARGGSGTGVSSFIELTDTPNSYAGAIGKYLRVNSSGTAIEFVDLPSGALTFLELTDTPNSYTGQGLKGLRVNSAGTAIEFFTMPGIPQLFTELSDVPTTYIGSENKLLAVNNAGTAIEFVEKNNPNKWIWDNHFVDAIGFNLVNALRPDANTGSITGNPMGVAWNRIETSTSFASAIRRDTTNGSNYTMQSAGSKYLFEMICNFEVLPTVANNYRAGWSFHNTTGIFSESRFCVFILNVAGVVTWRLEVAQTVLLFTQVNLQALISANTWYRFALEVDRANSIYRFYINGIVIYEFNSFNNIYNIPSDWFGFIQYSETSTNRATATRFIIDYYKETITPNTPLP